MTQRFDCLQLDIKAREITSVEDALSLYLSEETINDAGSAHYSKRMSIEVPPEVRVGGTYGRRRKG